MKNLKSVLALILVLVIGFCLTGCVSKEEKEAANAEFGEYFTDISIMEDVVTMTYKNYKVDSSFTSSSIKKMSAFVGNKEYNFSNITMDIDIDMSTSGATLILINTFEGLTTVPDKIVTVILDPDINNEETTITYYPNV
ncbi:MAG: hypothetical protein LBM18_05195 [Oscillospiraceae bacterium]|jgi:hypothetical protein|nr:hypothetical protein [Oscillospiraceae bacterium]